MQIGVVLSPTSATTSYLGIPRPRSRLGHTRVLLIADSLPQARLLSRFLHASPRAGGRFETRHASSLVQGLSEASSGHFDVLVADLPSEASEADRWLTALLDVARLVPVIVQSAKNARPTHAEILGHGIWDELIRGEVSSDILTRSIRYALDRHRLYEALNESEERYRLARMGAKDALWDWSLRTRTFLIPPQLKKSLGYGPQEIDDVVDAWFALVHPEDVEALASAIDAHLMGQTAYLEIEHRVLHKSGHIRWLLTRGSVLRTDDGQPYRMAGSHTDITNKKATEAKMMRATYYDKLTGLPNRSLLSEQIGYDLFQMRLASNDQGDNTGAQVLVVEMDRLSAVTDTLGREAGQGLAVAFAKRLGRLVGGRNLLARIGDNHFAFLIRDENLEDYISRTLQSLEKPFGLQGREIFINANMGIIDHLADYDCPEEVIRDALLATSRAKTNEESHHTVFDTTLRTEAIERIQLETDLRHAIVKQEFKLHYQPIISLSTGNISGFEALLRWHSPTRGLVMPDEFIGLAEETGLINPIGDWVIQEAIREIADLKACGLHRQALSISVNLSPRQFFQADLVKTLADSLRLANVAPELLILEITENVFFDEGDRAETLFRELKALGVKIHIDDFGTGYSSLSILRRYPVDQLKIDRSFISGLTSNHEDREIVRAIMALGKSLGKNVIAEGIETEEQLHLLESFGCGFGQGHYFAKPLPETSSWPPPPDNESFLSSLRAQA